MTTTTITNFGSCSHCDTFYAIREESYEEVPTPSQVRQYMVLATHMLQKMKEI